MAKDQVLNAYKQTDQIYVNGIETPHGRIKILLGSIPLFKRIFFILIECTIILS